ncbi:hypothetical protein M2315_005299 [Agrobacterium fabrum]|nr:hypothetical protein [Agrobacterium fabrum]
MASVFVMPKSPPHSLTVSPNTAKSWKRKRILALQKSLSKLKQKITITRLAYPLQTPDSAGQLPSPCNPTYGSGAVISSKYFLIPASNPKLRKNTYTALCRLPRSVLLAQMSRMLVAIALATGSLARSEHRCQPSRLLYSDAGIVMWCCNQLAADSGGLTESQPEWAK